MKKKIYTFLYVAVMLGSFFVSEVSAGSGYLLNVNQRGVAIDGYDAVAFFTVSSPVPGLMKYQSAYEGAIYQFCTAESKQQFEENPGKYVPQYGGFCAVSTSMGMIEPISIETWSIVDDKLYFQRNAKAFGMWGKDGPQMFIMNANKKWPELKDRYESMLTYKQVSEGMDLTLDAAKAIVGSGRKYAKEHMAPGGAIAVVDSGGHLICLERLDRTFPAASNVAIEKARTAAMFRFPSKKLEDGILGGRTSLITVGHNMLRGGVPIFFKGQAVGAVGVSGAASADQDVEIAIAGSHAVFE